jgi:hypothetical protein
VPMKVINIIFFLFIVQYSYSQTARPSDCDIDVSYSWNDNIVQLCENYLNVIEQFGPPDTIITDLSLGEKIIWYKGILYLVYRSNDQDFQNYWFETASFGPNIKVFHSINSEFLQVNDTVDKILKYRSFIRDRNDFCQQIGSYYELRLRIESDVVKSIRINTTY